MRTILGCGLSGFAAAIALAQKGEDVRILDRSSRVGSKFPESVHAFRNYNSSVDELEFIRSRGFAIDHLLPIHKIIKFGPSLNASETYSEEKPLFYAVKRGNGKESIDYQLFKLAENLQVEIQLGTNNASKNVDILATGSAFATEMGYGYHFKNVEVDPDSIVFLLNDYYAPKGYAYAIPYGSNEISVVTTSFDPSSFNKMPLLFKRLIEEVGIFSNLIKNGERGPAFAKIGSAFIPDTAIVNGRLLVGEAAGFAEADRGFGMHYALESGFLAAKSITENLNYDSLWKDSFRQELVKAFGRRMILNRIGNEHYDKMINAGTKMSAQEYAGYKDEHSTNLIKQFLIDMQIANEIRKSRKKFDIRRFYMRFLENEGVS